MVFWVWNNLLSTEEIVEINTVCKNNIDILHFDNPAENVIKTAKVNLVAWRYLQPSLENISELWLHINQRKFGYNLYPMMNRDFWNFNIYSSKNNGEYGYHLDVDYERVSDLKLTGIVNISDEPYEGGEFIAFYDDEFKEIPELSRPGSSILLRGGTIHKVNPVTEGTRKTLSFWLYGPPLV